MKFGVSTACFYPKTTLQSVQLLQQNNVQNIEIFFNTFCELQDDFIAGLKESLLETNTNVIATHPFSSGFDWFYFFTSYKDRINDGLKLYDRYAQITKILGANILSFHGDYLSSAFDFAESCKIFSEISKVCENRGVTLCQENVVRCTLGKLENIQRMLEILNGEVRFTLDLKQMLRAKISLQEMFAVLGDNIAHIHVSDYDENNDCIVPLFGNFPFSELKLFLQKIDYTGAMMVELYSDGFSDIFTLCNSSKRLESFFI